MSRARPVAGPTISLFPFLAVLLCTMGALLVVLVLFSRAAQQSVSANADAALRAQEEELAAAREEIEWRLRQLTGIRDRTAADLSRARMQLAGVEEDNRNLAEELATLERTAAAVEANTPPAAADTAAIDALERRLAAAQATLDAALAKGASRPAAYAVVPYVGLNGTHRRPLYIECSIDGIFLQPEGIRLSPADFEGPPGPGNPLASALRAAREHIARTAAGSGDPALQPYPLLLVRPSGVMAYYAAREAIQSWGSEFGYQFIDEDWELNFPPRDPALADAESRAVEESRRRLAWLAEVRPTKAARPAKHYRAATTRGGVVSDGGPSVLGDQSRFDWTEDQAGGGDAVGGGRGPGGPLGGGARAGGGGDLAADEAAWSRAAADSSGGDAGGTPGAARAGSVRAGGAGGGATGGSSLGGDGRYAGPSKFYVGDRGGAGTAGEGPGGEGGPAAATGAGRGPASGNAAAGAMDTAGASGAGGSSSSRPSGRAGGQAGGGAGASSAATGGGGGGPSMPGLAQGGASSSPAAPSATAAAGGASASVSLAGARGSNWASMATQDRPIPLRRPIRVECAAQEFRILDDGAGRVESRIPIRGATAESVDPLVEAVRSKVNRWGLAGDRMYWKPELVLTETADGGSRREELEQLLADSGLDTRRAGGPEMVRPLPPIERTSALLPSR